MSKPHRIMKRYKKYVIGKISRNSKGNESFFYFPTPIEETTYAIENSLDLTKLAVVRDLIFIYLTDADGMYALDPILKTFVHLEELDDKNS